MHAHSGCLAQTTASGQAADARRGRACAPVTKLKLSTAPEGLSAWMGDASGAARGHRGRLGPIAPRRSDAGPRCILRADDPLIIRQILVRVQAGPFKSPGNQKLLYCRAGARAPSVPRSEGPKRRSEPERLGHPSMTVPASPRMLAACSWVSRSPNTAGSCPSSTATVEPARASGTEPRCAQQIGRFGAAGTRSRVRGADRPTRWRPPRLHEVRGPPEPGT
jgi:hypothetical protein